MAEHSPKIIESEDKATTIDITLSLTEHELKLLRSELLEMA